MFCSNCGAKNNDGSKFCFSCGNPMPTPAPVEEVQAPVEPVVEPEEEKTMLFVPNKSVEPDVDATMAFTPVAPVEPVAPVTPVEPVAPIYAPVAPTYSNYQPVAEPVSVPAPAPQNPKKKSNKGLVIAIIAIAVVLAATLGVCIGMGVFDSDKKEKTEETTTEKKETTTEEKKEEKPVQDLVQYNYKTIVINGNSYAIAFDEKNRVIFAKGYVVYYTFDDQGKIEVNEDGQVIKNFLNEGIVGSEYVGIVIDGILYLPTISCKLPDGWTSNLEQSMVYPTDPNLSQCVGFDWQYGTADELFETYMNDAHDNNMEVTVTEDVTVPGTNIKAKKGSAVLMLDGNAEFIKEFYVFETSYGVSVIYLDAYPSHIDENFDFDTFIKTNVTVY